MAPTLKFPESTEPALDTFPDYFEPIDKFPEYSDPTATDIDIMAPSAMETPINRLVEQVIRTPGRQPSPQPTHFSVPYKNGTGGNGHRVLRSATVGYVAPEFKGKAAQMLQG